MSVPDEPPQTPAELKEQIEAERLGLPLLVHRDSEGAQRIVTLETERGELWIGRSPAADISLPGDEQVSKLHARIEHVGAEATLVDDGLSRNGSFVNEERVGGRRMLRDGDVIRVGRTRIRFRAPGGGGDSTVVAADLAAAAGVSPAQRRVLVALCRPFKDGSGFATPPTNAEIAAELHLSIDAIKTHLRALFEKFDLADAPQSRKRVDLVRRAMQAGIVADRDL
ncbi:MAG TPA: FHA domain-containing protein [Solirubrobacterales bacterium]|nr:FHA domain-containing protein [Solirubrobacterales bacterium]